MLVSPIVSDQGYASTINSPICDSDNERFSNEKHNIFMQQRGDARIDMNSPALVAMSPDSSFVNTSSTDSSPRAGAKFHRQKDSLSSSISFGASRAGLKNSRGGSGTQYPSSLAVSVSNTPVLVSDAQFGQQKPSFWDSAPYWLTLYFFFNLSLTLYNKFALVSFPYPWTLTCIHSLSATVGSYIAYRKGYFQRSASPALREQLVLLAFSSLYTINIAVSNLSLNLVSVPVHQVVRSTTPLFTMAISICLFSKSYLLQTYVSLIPVILGVCLATYGDYSFTTWGLLLTLLGALLAAVKGIATNRILVGRLKFHPLDLLLRMSPLAFGQCLLFSIASGELSEVYTRTFVTQTLTRGQWMSLFMNGTIAFGLNVVSFTANKKTGALTMSVAANVKQVLTIVLAVVIFNLTINGTNLLGIASTIVGGAYYSYVEYKSKQAGSKSNGSSSAAPSALSTPLLSGPSASNDMLGIHSGASLPYPYYEKLSPLPMDSSSNPFAEAQAQQQNTKMQQAKRNEEYYQNHQKGGGEEVISAAAANAYHRKVNSLAAFREFQYPIHK